MMVVIILSAVLMLIFQCAVSDAVDDFSECSEFFLDKQPPEIPDVLVGGKSQNQYRTICQKDVNKEKTFATLYDTESRIPVFSAYTYSGKGNFNRDDLKQKWKTGPQLEEKVPLCDKQATRNDYSEKNREKVKVNRGHLFPVCQANDLDTAESTFKLTNAVPQKVSFNGGSWNRMETYTKRLMNSHCRDNNQVAYVLTGAVPTKNPFPENKLNDRVNIPSMMWTAFCCCDSKKTSCFSKAHWAPNIDEDEKDTTKTIVTESLTEVLEKLQDELKKTGLKLFNDKNCLIDKPVNKDLPPPDTKCEDQKSFWSTIWPSISSCTIL